MLNRIHKYFPEKSAETARPGTVSAHSNAELLQEENRLLRAVIDNFSGGLSLFDKNLKLVLCNEQQKKLLDYPANLFEYGAPTLEQLFRFNAIRGEYGPGDIEKHVEYRMTLVSRRRAHSFERARPNGTVVQIRDVPLDGGGFLMTCQDVTEQRRNSAETAPDAEHDALTGLPNAILLRERLDQVLARVRRGQVAAIHYLNIDHFKGVNASFGRATGDLLLRTVAVRLRGLLRGSDTVARIGGDRFLVVQPDVARPSDVTWLASRIIDSIRRPFDVDGQSITLGTSIGLALAPRDGTDYEPLMAKAQAAVLDTKSRNRGDFEAGTVGWK